MKRSKSIPKRKTEVDEFYKALMSDMGESDLIEDDQPSDLSKTEELFEADLVAVENSINEPRNSTLIETPEIIETADNEENIDAQNSILELSALEEQLSDLG